jgi:hypothetical protein
MLAIFSLFETWSSYSSDFRQVQYILCFVSHASSWQSFVRRMEKPSQHASACTNILHASTDRNVVIRYTPAKKKHCTSITPPLQSKMPIRFWAARKYASPWRNSFDWRKRLESTPCPFFTNDVAIEPLAYMRS